MSDKCSKHEVALLDSVLLSILEVSTRVEFARVSFICMQWL